ncbi:choice-of-anchor A family protein [Bifidobacterium sp. SO1]|nr:choice-of-anchor A family protein [Bifidobacterium sp. SO1]
MITFTGDGTQQRQVFNINMNTLEVEKSKLGIRQWSLAFNNIPDGQPIIINLYGKNGMDWYPGWRIWVNGQDYSTPVGDRGAARDRFRSIASRIIWNLPNATGLTMHYAWFKEVDRNKSDGLLSNNTSNGVMFPGSILIPRGGMEVNADTNGRLYVGKNLTLNIWEHHNIAWIGFNEPQCFAVNGSTKASLS